MSADHLPHPAPLPSLEDCLERLVSAALDEACERQSTALPLIWDAQDEPVTIVLVPATDWLAPTASLFQSRKAPVWTCGKRGSTGEDMEMALRLGQAGVWIARDPAAIPELVTIVADRTLVLEGLSRAAIGRVIAARTGDTIDLADPDWQGLGLYALAAAIASGRSAKDCRARLRRFSQRARSITPTDSTRFDLPLDGPAQVWFDETLTTLAALDAGTFEAGRIRHSLLAGAPGVGKSSLVRQLAQQAAVPLHVISVSEVFAATDGHLNTVVRAVRSFFERLMAEPGPVIGLIEELDAVNTRERRHGSNDQYWSTLISTFLLAIDALNQKKAAILLIGCTNRPEDIDPALRRPGRIGNMVHITAPRSVAAVEAVLRYHLDSELAGAVLTDIAAELLGESHAALADLVTAARNRASLEHRDLDLSDLLPAGSSLTSVERLHLRHTAVHEAAHAVVATALGRTVLEMHLRSREQITGVTVIEPAVSGLTLAERLDAVTIALAGRTADRIINNRVCDGAASDLAKATQSLAELHWGSGLMDSPVVLSPNQIDALLIHDHELTRMIHKRLIDQADRAEQLIRRHSSAIERLAGHLLERRSLYANDLVPLLEDLRP